MEKNINKFYSEVVKEIKREFGSSVRIDLIRWSEIGRDYIIYLAEFTNVIFKGTQNEKKEIYECYVRVYEKTNQEPNKVTSSKLLDSYNVY